MMPVICQKRPAPRSTAAQLGEAVLSLFSPGLESLANETLSFETVHGSIVSYRRPSDAFLDCGDGHTDAYQIPSPS